MTRHRTTATACTLALLLSAGACAPPSVPALRPDQAVPAGEAAVVGRIVVWDGDAAVIGSAGRSEPADGWNGFFVAIVPEGSAVVFSQEVTDGALRWHLAPGRYAVTGYARKGASTISGPVQARFEVPAGAGAVCIGTLHLAFRSRRPAIAVEDDCDAELAAIQRPTATRALFEPDDDLRGATRDGTLDGMDESIGSKLYAVRPVAPVPGEQVANLRPTLQWEPLGTTDTADLRYDLRVYRQVMVGDDLRYGRIATWGPLVVERFELPAPRHAIERPLDPKADYLWQVRQRRGDRVGPWSRRDTALILVLYNRWQRGVPFDFSTPPDP